MVVDMKNPIMAGSKYLPKNLFKVIKAVRSSTSSTKDSFGAKSSQSRQFENSFQNPSLHNVDSDFIEARMPRKPVSHSLGEFGISSFLKPSSVILPLKVASTLCPSIKKIFSDDKVSVERNQYKDVIYYNLKPVSGSRKGSKTYFYCHGGANVLGLLQSHVRMAKNIVEESGSHLVIVDYPLIPKHDFCTIHNQVYQLYNIISKGSPNGMVMMGDSAGGGITTGITLRLIDEGSPYMPTHTLLISPWLDLSMDNPALDENRRKEVILSKKFLRRAGKAYAGHTGVYHPYVSPAYGKITAYPPTFVVSSDCDILNADALQWIRKLREQGNPHVYYEYKNEMHDFLAFAPDRHRFILKEMAMFVG